MSDKYREIFQGKESQKINEEKRNDFFNLANTKILENSSIEDYASEAESERFIKNYVKLQFRYIPEIDYSNPNEFAYYGSAEKYYKDSIERIYNTYPYDGSRAERVEWSLSASYLDLYMLEHEYQSSKGHITIGSEGWGQRPSNQEGGYGLSDLPEYVYFTGAPKKGFVYSSSKGRENSLKIDGSAGNTVEFWLKKGGDLIGHHTDKEVICDIHTTGLAEGHNSYGRFRIELDSTTAASESPFRITYLSGSNGISSESIGAGTTMSSVADGNWHHYSFALKNSGSNLICDMYTNGEKIETKVFANQNLSGVDGNLVGALGALSAKVAGAADVGWGKLSGSLDEFRYWKRHRTNFL